MRSRCSKDYSRSSKASKCISLGYGQSGNLAQDIAAIRSLRKLAQQYFAELGYQDYALSTVFHQWMGGFPENERKPIR